MQINTYNRCGRMSRSPLEHEDIIMCKYDAMFYEKNNNVVYGTISRDTYKYHQTTAHARMIVYDNVAFIVDADIYYHANECEPLTEHAKELTSEWLDAFKPNGVTTIYNQDRSHEAYILTKRIFHNVIVRDILDQNVDLPNDVIGIIKDMDLAQSGLDYVCDPGNPEIWPFKVQDLNGFTKRPIYRVVFREVEEDTWNALPDILNPNYYVEI